MKIDIARLPEDGATFVGELPGSVLGLDQDREARSEGPVRYRLRVCMSAGHLLVEGELRTEARFRCSRCGESFVAAIREDRFHCMHEPGRTEAERREEGGWSEEDPDDGEDSVGREAPADQLVDLTGDIRDTMLLAFPSHPVCDSACKGLCSRCGANLNRERCGCRSATPDGRWSTLDNLKL